MVFHNKCPLCGTEGKSWKGDQEVLQCPNCSSLYSKFGLVMEARKDVHEFWS